MKRIIVLFCAVLYVACLFGCSNKENIQNNEDNGTVVENNDKSWAEIPEYSKDYPTAEDLTVAYNAAYNAFGWMALTSAPPLDLEDIYVFEDMNYYRVDYEYLQSLSDLELYYKTLFDDETTQMLMEVNEEIGRFVEKEDGGLYCMGFTYKPQGYSEEETFTAYKNSEDSYTYTVGYYTVDENGNKKNDYKENFTYEKVDGRWIFTDFYVYRQ